MQAANPQVANLGKTAADGAVRRLALVGKPITLEGVCFDGKALDWKRYSGKVVLVHFWASSSPPCRAEIAELKKLYEAHHDRGFDIVGVGVDQDRAAATRFKDAEKLPWTCVFDANPGNEREPLGRYYGIFGIPHGLLVDRDGRVVSINARAAEMEPLLEKYLGPRRTATRTPSDWNRYRELAAKCNRGQVAGPDSSSEFSRGCGGGYARPNCSAMKRHET